MCNSPPLFPKHFCCWCRGWRLLQHNAASSNYGSNSSEYLLQQNPKAQIEKPQWKIITCGKSWNSPVFSKKTSVKLGSPSFRLPSVQVLFAFYKLFFPREKELKIKQKKKTLAKHFVPLQALHWEQSQVRATSLSTNAHLHCSHLPELYPPPLAVSNPGPFPQGLRAAAAGTKHRHRIYICCCLTQGSNLSLLFPKAKGRATEDIQKPCVVTSFSLLKECHSQNSTQNLGSGGQEMGARNQSKWPAESETFRNKGSLETYTHSNPLHRSYHQMSII